GHLAVRHSFPTRRSSDLSPNVASRFEKWAGPQSSRCWQRRIRATPPPEGKRPQWGAGPRPCATGALGLKFLRQEVVTPRRSKPGDRKSTRLNSSHVKISY